MGLMDQRHRGLIGFDKKPGGEIWWVRITDPESPFKGVRFPVASVCGGLKLVWGLNVRFTISKEKNESGREVLRAADVCSCSQH